MYRFWVWVARVCDETLSKQVSRDCWFSASVRCVGSWRSQTVVLMSAEGAVSCGLCLALLQDQYLCFLQNQFHYQQSRKNQLTKKAIFKHSAHLSGDDDVFPQEGIEQVQGASKSALQQHVKLAQLYIFVQSASADPDLAPCIFVCAALADSVHWRQVMSLGQLCS